MHDIGLLILHEHTLVAQALGYFLSRQSSLLVVGLATDPLTALEIARAEAPDVALLHIQCLDREGARLDERLRGLGIPSLLLVSRGDTRVKELGMGREDIFWCDEPLKALATTIRREAGAITAEVEQRRFRRRVWTPRLTPRESAVLRLVAEGRSSKEISEKLGLTFRTVNNHRAKLMKKFAVCSGTGLVRAAIRNGFIEP